MIKFILFMICMCNLQLFANPAFPRIEAIEKMKEEIKSLGE